MTLRGGKGREKENKPRKKEKGKVQPVQSRKESSTRPEKDRVNPP